MGWDRFRTRFMYPFLGKLLFPATAAPGVAVLTSSSAAIDAYDYPGWR